MLLSCLKGYVNFIDDRLFVCSTFNDKKWTLSNIEFVIIRYTSDINSNHTITLIYVYLLLFLHVRLFLTIDMGLDIFDYIVRLMALSTTIQTTKSQNRMSYFEHVAKYFNRKTLSLNITYI